MVVHLKDRPNSTPLDLLAALMENEQNNMLANSHYPPATSGKPVGEHDIQITADPHIMQTNRTGMSTEE